MAIIFEDSTTCPLCGFILNKEENIILFPPLTSNTLDSLFIVSDRGVHKSCLNRSSIKDSALFLKEEYYKILPLSKATCFIDNKPVKNPKNLIVVGLLTSDKNEKLYKYNYICLNSENLEKWSQKTNFLELLIDFDKSGKWKDFSDFNYLKSLIIKLSTS